VVERDVMGAQHPPAWVHHQGTILLGWVGVLSQVFQDV
jgi:hypothetical protein